MHAVKTTPRNGRLLKRVFLNNVGNHLMHGDMIAQILEAVHVCRQPFPSKVYTKIKAVILRRKVPEFYSLLVSISYSAILSLMVGTKSSYASR